MSNKQQSILIINLGLVANIFLAGLKTSIGVLGRSPALLADGINSTSDVVYYVVVAIFVRLAHKPADHEHPYGHRQLESIAALVVGAFVITTAVAIFWNALNTLYNLWLGQNGFDGAAPIALWVALFTILLKIGLARYTRRVGQQANNPAVLALASDHRNDIFSAGATAVGIFLGQAGYLWVDPLAAALVAAVVLHTGLSILREASDDLMDTIPGEALAKEIAALIEPIAEVWQIEEIHAHRFGPYFVVNVTVGVNGRLSIAAGDAIACQVEQTLYHHLPYLRRVYVHYHPAKSQAAPAPLDNLIICEPPQLEAVTS